ncbi:MAG: hypothetical protein AB7T38_03160 [Nitrospirales bacterium]
MKEQSLTPLSMKDISFIFSALDYQALGSIYCDEGGHDFWEDRRKPCEKMGIRVAKALKSRLASSGQSLYVGAGVAEIPPLIMETLDLGREVFPYNLRKAEVSTLNRSCKDSGITFFSQPAETASGKFDHLWIVSVLNDPEQFPHLSALSYNRADPIHFDPAAFAQERKAVWKMLSACMQKLTYPALVTTSVEEHPWVAHWCETYGLPSHVEKKTYPTALVGDPICFIWVGLDGKVPINSTPGRP